MKSLAFIHRDDTRFAVGDFRPVLSVFSYRELGGTVSPFLLLDHIGPGQLRPTPRRAGVHDHPHRGFETVTLVFAGELEHRDSQGGGGLIGPGDVQWMTAGDGIVHRELFSEAFARQGGRFEMIQLWVNLPAADKRRPPRYQSLSRAAIPVVTLPGQGGTVRVIAGAFEGVAGPARTHTRMTVLDVALAAGQAVTLPAADGDTALIYLRDGQLQLAGGDALSENDLAVLSSHGSDIALTAQSPSRLLLLGGDPLHEPIVGHGPFVMNSHADIVQAYEDIKQGRLPAAGAVEEK